MATRSTDKPAEIRHAAGDTPSPLPPPTGGSGPALDPRLVAELAGPVWEQSWNLTSSISTPAADPGARQRLWTLAAMLRPFARDAFAISDERVALDLRCGEGWLAQQLLGWGARRVVACDDRPTMLRRAGLLRDHFAIGPDELVLLERSAEGVRFDVVLLTGVPELAGDSEALTGARGACRSICAIECTGTETNAVAEAALSAGFGSVERVRPPLQGSPVYVLERRDLLIAKVETGR